MPSNSKSVKLSRYDVGDHLRSPEGMAGYLYARLDEFSDDNSGIARAVGYIAQAVGYIARAKGMTKAAKDAGLIRESLCRALSEEGNPSFRRS